MERALAPVVGQKLRELLEFAGERLDVALIQSANSPDKGIVPGLRGGKQDIAMASMRVRHTSFLTTILIPQTQPLPRAFQLSGPQFETNRSDRGSRLGIGRDEDGA